MKAKKENVRNKSSARRKLIPAISMLTVSAIMLSTATYAWFTMNKEVEMTGLNMTATTGEGMEISLASVTGETNTLSFPTTGHPDDATTEKGWKSSVLVGNYYKDIGKLKPASSVDGKTFFDAEDATDGGRQAKNFKQVSIESGANQAAKETESTLVSSTDKKLTSNGESGYYVDIPVHLRTSKVGTGTNEIYYKMMINKGTSEGTNPELYKAVRVAFIPTTTDTASSTKIFTCDELNNYYEQGTTAGKAVKTAPSTKEEITILTNDSVSSSTEFTGNGADSGLKIPLATTSGEYGHLDFTVRVWLEGESTSCFNDNAGQSWNINFKFSMGAFPTTP